MLNRPTSPSTAGPSRAASFAPSLQSSSSTTSLPAAAPEPGSIRTHSHVVRAFMAPGNLSDLQIRLILESYVAYKLSHGRNKWQMSAKLLRLEYSFPAHARVHRIVRAYFELPESAYAVSLFTAGVAASLEAEAEAGVDRQNEDGEWAPVPPPAYKCKPPGYACAGIEPAPPTYATKPAVKVEAVPPKIDA